jgi:putative cell wall-binding protein
VSTKKMGLRRVGIVGLSTLVATSMMSMGAVTAQAAWAGSGGQIGLVDTQPTVDGTQGATMVTPGVNGQAIGDIRLLIPNTFKSGDTIDLTVLDRAASVAANNDGNVNASPAHKVAFTGAPTVTVTATPFVGSTTIDTTSPGVAGGTENVPVADTAAGHATTPPTFTTTVVSSSRGSGLPATDIIRLKAGTLSGGLAADMWMISLTGIKADIGADVAPGELRVVPFAYDGDPTVSGTTVSNLFGNTPPTTPPTFNPVINTYTVPAYVAPASFTVGAPNNIVADGTVQSIGDISIGELNKYSLQDGTYTVAVGGATVANSASQPMTVTATGLTASEAVVKSGAANAIQFDVTGAVQTTKISIKISGVLLSSSTPGPVTYTLTGGSIDGNASHSFLVTAGSSAEIPLGFIGTSGVEGVADDADFTTGSVNQTDIVAPALVVNAVSTDVIHRIGGSDRYETAAKIALNNGANDYIVLASGENFPDALSSGYLANQIGGGSIVLTQQAALPPVTATAMRELGTRTVFIIGGPNAISAGVEAQLRDTPQYYPGGHETIGQGKLDVIRLGGTDRYNTNQIVNQYAAAMLHGDPNPVGRTSITFGAPSKLTAFVATGENFPDALAVGPGTAGAQHSAPVSGSLPLILTPSGSLTESASSQMDNLGIEQVVIAGGTNAISAGVASDITAKGVAVDRFGGVNRFATAALIADFENAEVAPTTSIPGGLGFDGSTVILTNGYNFPDALSGAPFAGGSESPIMLTDPTTLSPETNTWLLANAAQYDSVIALGLGQAVSNAVLDAANAAVATL